MSKMKKSSKIFNILFIIFIKNFFFFEFELEFFFVCYHESSPENEMEVGF